MGMSAEEIAEEFEEFGEEVLHEELSRLQEMCKSWNIDANRIVNEWMAFSATRKVNLDNDGLDVFDREWLHKKLISQAKMKTPKDNRKMYTKDNINSAIDDEFEVLKSYSTPEERAKMNKAAIKRQLTPEDLNSSKRLQTGLNRSPRTSGVFSPVAVSSASATPSAKYSSRSNAGEVVSEFGNTNNAQWAGDGHRGCKITHFDPALEIMPKVKYMFQKMSEKAIVLNDVIQEMSTVLQNAHGIEDYAHLALPSQDDVTVCGRICCDSVGRLNKQSVILEGSRQISAGKCISLDLSELKQFSLFPGQVIACDGVNITGQKFTVNKIYDSVRLPFPEISETDSENVAGKLRLAVAAGPYAPSNSLDYSPLSDLIKYVNRDKPDVLVLMGPFVDVKNTLISTGDVEESFEEIFTNQMMEIGRATQSLNCKVVIVSSSRDAHNLSAVYPQPPYHIKPHRPDGTRRNLYKRLAAELEVLKHLMFVSDPSTLKVNGVTIGITSTDTLMHLTKSEISVGAPGGADRMTRLAQHILRQRSYYPLYPPLEEMNVDYEMWEAHAHLPVTPHLLILPSDLKAFIKDVDGCCCLNPGRLTTGLVGGTYAKMVIDVPAVLSSKSPSVSCQAQIVKV